MSGEYHMIFVEVCINCVLLCGYSVSLPAAIVDALGDSDIEYGEVLVYELTTDFLRFGPPTECYIATLRFTDFTGKYYVMLTYTIFCCV